MAVFRLKFWELLSEKELAEGRRYANISELSEQIGISRPTFYKYVDGTLTSIDVNVIESVMAFLGLDEEELARLLVLEHDPQSKAQGVPAAGVPSGVPVA